MSLAEVAPIGPALGEPALAGFLVLTAILLCLVAIALRGLIAYWLRPLTHALAWILGHINLNAWKVHVNIGSWLAAQVLKLEHIVEHYMGSVASGMFATSNVLFHHAGALVRLAWTQLEGLAADTVWAFQWFRKNVVPQLVKALLLSYVGEAILGAKLLKWIGQELGHLVGRALRYVYRKLHSVETRVVNLTRVVAQSGAAAIPHAIPNLRDLVKQALKDLGKLWAFPRRLRWLLALGSLAALTAAILRKAGLRWLTCRNVGRTGRALCGLPPGLVHMLVDGAFGAAVVFDICRTVNVIEGIAEKTEPFIRALVIAEDDLIDHCGNDLPSASGAGGYSGPWLPTGLLPTEL